MVYMRLRPRQTFAICDIQPWSSIVYLLGRQPGRMFGAAFRGDGQLNNSPNLPPYMGGTEGGPSYPQDRPADTSTTTLLSFSLIHIAHALPLLSDAVPLVSHLAATYQVRTMVHPVHPQLHIGPMYCIPTLDVILAHSRLSSLRSCLLRLSLIYHLLAYLGI